MAARIHETALVESDQIGDGTKVWAFAHVMPGAQIGRDCHICDHVYIEGQVVLGDRVTVKNNCLLWDGVRVGDDVFIGPNVVFTNDLLPRPLNKTAPEDFLDTVVESGASIGANTTIVCGVTIGEHALVGAGSVVTGDVRPHELVAGNPARRVGWICICGERIGDVERCEACDRVYAWTDGVPSTE